MPTPIDILAEVTDARGALCWMVDGGFRSGPEIVKALAMGANRVLGRATPCSGKAGGRPGRRVHVIEMLHQDVERTLGLIRVPARGRPFDGIILRPSLDLRHASSTSQPPRLAKMAGPAYFLVIMEKSRSGSDFETVPCVGARSL